MSDLPTPKTDVGGIFRLRLEELAETAAQNFMAALGGGPAAWYRPAEIDHSPLTEDGNNDIHEAFSRSEQESWFDESTKDPKDQGTYGDLAQISLQGDMLSCLERAYRARHQTTCQTRIYPAARLRTHGHDFGVIKGSMIGFIQGIDTVNKGETVGSQPE